MGEAQSLREWLTRDRSQIALVFTDIVGSTRLANRMGDDDWIGALTEHFKKARFYKQMYGGYEVKLIGDACMVAFHTAWPAVQFALDFSADTGDAHIKIKAGVHLGEVSVVENDMYGVMVNYTARVVKAASSLRGTSNVIICGTTLQHVRAALGVKARKELEIVALEQTLPEFPSNQQQLYKVMRKVAPPDPKLPTRPIPRLRFR